MSILNKNIKEIDMLTIGPKLRSHILLDDAKIGGYFKCTQTKRTGWRKKVFVISVIEIEI